MVAVCPNPRVRPGTAPFEIDKAPGKCLSCREAQTADSQYRVHGESTPAQWRCQLDKPAALLRRPGILIDVGGEGRGAREVHIVSARIVGCPAGRAEAGRIGAVVRSAFDELRGLIPPLIFDA